MNSLSFLFFFITYWVDKTTLLRFYQRPPHREDALQRQVRSKRHNPLVTSGNSLQRAQELIFIIHFGDSGDNVKLTIDTMIYIGALMEPLRAFHPSVRV